MHWVGRSIVAGALLLIASAAGAMPPLTVSLMRGGDDRLTNGLVDAVRAAGPAAGVTFASLGTPGAVPVEFGVPRPYGRHHFMMPVGQPGWKMAKHNRFHQYHVNCDKRQEDACASRVLALLDKRFRWRG